MPRIISIDQVGGTQKTKEKKNQYIVYNQESENETETEKTDEATKETEKRDNTIYKSYPQRWWILISVVILTISNFAHWICFASVTSKSSIFFQRSNKDISRIITVASAVAFPSCIVATIVLMRFGIRTGIFIGGFLTFLGGFVCCLSTFPIFRENFDPAVWYWMTLTGRAMAGIGGPFIGCLTTKISHHWFSQNQRLLATTILGHNVRKQYL
jgi:hypothetical protein